VHVGQRTGEQQLKATAAGVDDACLAKDGQQGRRPLDRRGGLGNALSLDRRLTYGLPKSQN